MKIYEIGRFCTFPFMPAFMGVIRADLKNLLRKTEKENPKVLDVGGRKSPYTIGLPLSVTLMDLPRESDVQQKLNLGITSSILDSIQINRSNVSNIILEDMTRSTQMPESFDAVICVEVIEHVPEDDTFVKNIAHVICKGGWAYFTTPNGDYIKNEPPNKNPDHIRHYKKSELEDLLLRYFDHVDVKYAIKTGKFRMWGMPGYTIRRPVKTIKSLIGNMINQFQSQGLEDRSQGTAHLVATCYKR